MDEIGKNYYWFMKYWNDKDKGKLTGMPIYDAGEAFSEFQAKNSEYDNVVLFSVEVIPVCARGVFALEYMKESIKE